MNTGNIQYWFQLFKFFFIFQLTIGEAPNVNLSKTSNRK